MTDRTDDDRLTSEVLWSRTGTFVTAVLGKDTPTAQINAVVQKVYTQMEFLVRGSQRFMPGQKLWWMGSGFGYVGKIPVTAISVTPMGKSVRVQYTTNWTDRENRTGISAVRCTSLEPRA